MLNMIYKNSIFSSRVVNTWNSLTNWVVSANTIDMFKARLDKFWHNQDIVHNFRARLHLIHLRIDSINSGNIKLCYIIGDMLP